VNTPQQRPIPWSSFAASLADVARRLPGGGVFVMHLDERTGERLGPEWVKYVQLCRWGGTMLRCEVVSNTYLPPEHGWTPEQEAQLSSIGWCVPDPGEPTASPNWYLDVHLAWAEAGIDRIIRVLRDVWGARMLDDVLIDRSSVGRLRWIDTPENPDDGARD
jgi:hypothetical protein